MRCGSRAKSSPAARAAATPGRKPWRDRVDTAPPVQTPVQSNDTGAVQTFDTGAVHRLDRLESDVPGMMDLVRALVDRLDHPPVQTPVQITALPPTPRARQCAGICGSRTPCGMGSRRWPRNGRCRPANWCKRSCGNRSTQTLPLPVLRHRPAGLDPGIQGTQLSRSWRPSTTASPTRWRVSPGVVDVICCIATRGAVPPREL
jgi:hypothetical protein